MLREGLRAEIPKAFGLAARVRLPSVHQMAPALAGVAALGVRSLTTALVGTLQSASYYAGWVLPFRQADAIAVAAYALAIVFAYGSARWRGVLAATLLFALLSVEQLWLSLPGRQLFCERAGASCDPFGLALAQFWPPALGVALGVAARRALRQGVPGVSALALGLGLGALVIALSRVASVPFIGFTPTGSSAAAAINTFIAAGLIGALVLGLVVGILGRCLILDGILIAIVYIGPWTPQLRLWRDSLPPGRGFILAIDWQSFVPVAYAAVALLAIVGGVLIRRARGSSGPQLLDAAPAR